MLPMMADHAILDNPAPPLDALGAAVRGNRPEDDDPSARLALLEKIEEVERLTRAYGEIRSPVLEDIARKGESWVPARGWRAVALYGLAAVGRTETHAVDLWLEAAGKLASEQAARRNAGRRAAR